MPPFEELVKTLEHCRLRKGMYVGVPTIESVGQFLTGFFSASIVCGLSGAWNAEREATKRRGWNVWPIEPHPVEQMRQKGMSDEAIMDELIVIHIEAIRQLAQQSASKP